MASATTPAVQAPEPEPVSSIGRMFGVLFSPKATFESIARRPTWLLPLVLISVLALSVVGVFSKRVGWQSFFEKQDASASRFQQLSPQQQAQAIQAQVKYGPPVVYAIAAISTFAAAVVIAAIFLAMFNLLSGTKLDFKTSLGIVAHAWVPGVISGLLAVLVLFLKDPSTVDLQNLVASNAGAFLSSDSPKWQIALLGSLDLFSFWMMILMAMGYSAAAPKKISIGKGLASIFCVWLLYVIIKVGLTAAFS